MAFYESGRRIVYTNEVPYETDVLATNDYMMAATGWLAEAIIGFGINNTTTVVGLPCTPISPPGMSVVIGPGAMFSYEFYDTTAYGVIPADVNPNHRLYKTAMNWNPITLAVTAPPTPGDSVIYLIEGIFETVDVNDTSRPYFNSSDPTMPIFLNNYDTRTDLVLFQVKSGVPGVTPSAPAPDAGYTGLYYVTVSNGQTTIISGNIAKVSTVEGQPFITEGLTQKVSATTIATGYVSIPAQQSNTYVYAFDVGSVNAIVVNPVNSYPAYVPGMEITVQVSNVNTGATTLNVSSNGAVNVQIQTEVGLVDLTGNEIVGGGIYKFVHNGTSFELLNPTTFFTFPQQNIFPAGNYGTNPWQRGTTFPAIANNTYTADRVRYNKSGTVVHTISKSATVPTVALTGYFTSASWLATVTTAQTSPSGASDICEKVETIEGYDFSPIAQKQFTYSAVVRASVAGVYCVAFQNSGQDRSYVTEVTINAIDTWQRITITVPASPSGGTWDYTNGIGLYCRWQLMANPGSTFVTATTNAWQTGNFVITANQANNVGTNGNTFYVALEKFEPGNVYTGFTDLQRSDLETYCQRYYQKSYDTGLYAGSLSFAGAGASNCVGSLASDLTITSYYQNNIRTTVAPTIYSPQTGTSGFVYGSGGDRAAVVDSSSVNSFVTLNIGPTITGNIYYVQFTVDADFY